MRKIDWGGTGQIPEALGQDHCGSFLSINRDFFPCKAERSTLRLTLNIGLRHVGCNAARPLTQNVLSALYHMEPQPPELSSSQW